MWQKRLCLEYESEEARKKLGSGVSRKEGIFDERVDHMQKPDSFVFLANVGFQHEMVALRKY
jgi:hypothetical protein